VRITGRAAMGVTLFRLDVDEHVTSVFPVMEDEMSDDGDDGEQNEARGDDNG
jgi:DNA gyrase subunit A